MPLTIATDYHNDLAVRLATACKLAYDLVANPQANPPDGYTIDQPLLTAIVEGKLETIGYTMRSKSGEMILCFRGTQTSPDFVADATYDQVVYPFAKAGKTHEGFTGVYTTCRHSIQQRIAVLPAGMPLFITGHSLGAAIATLAALDIATNTPITEPTVYTIASPRVGDPAFADAYDAAVPVNWRVLNSYDVVPLLPPQQIYDVLHGGYFYYEHVATWHPVGFVKGGIVANHAIENYVEALKNATA